MAIYLGLAPSIYDNFSKTTAKAVTDYGVIPGTIVGSAKNVSTLTGAVASALNKANTVVKDTIGFGLLSGSKSDSSSSSAKLGLESLFDNSSNTPVYQSDGGTAVAVPDYVNADLAKAYGMDASTAYQEALSNTSYQRAAADLQAAGINPMLAVQGLSGASGVYSAHMAGDGSLSTGVSSAKGAHTFYNLFSNLGTAIGAITGGRTGSVAGKAIGTLLGNAFDNLG